jgi:uncharacterized protein
MANAPLPGATDWRGAIARILLFVILFLAFGIVLVMVVEWLGVGPGRGAVFATGVVGSVAAIAAGGVLLRWADGRAVGALGAAWTRHTGRHIVLGLATGATGIVVAAALMALTGALAYESAPGNVATFARVVTVDLVVLSAPAFVEEAIFRGYPFQALVAWVGAWPATLLSSALFALAHGRNPEVTNFALANIFLAGVLLAAAYLRTRSLWFATAVHLGWNWCMASILALPVSGWTLFAPPLYRARIGGPQWWSGGEFGPEGGVVGTIGIVVALLLVFRLPAVRMDEDMRALRPLVDETEEMA